MKSDNEMKYTCKLRSVQDWVKNVLKIINYQKYRQHYQKYSLMVNTIIQVRFRKKLLLSFIH